jgi:hypothetical protein
VTSGSDGNYLGTINITTGAVTDLGATVAGLDAIAAAQALVPNDAFQVSYVSNLNVGDSVVNFTNTGQLIDPANLTGSGNICVNVYVFDPAEELQSCCSCLATPNGLESLSAVNDLVGSNALTPGSLVSAVIKLVASQPVSGICNPASPTFANLAPGLRAWGTTLHALPTNPVSYGVTDRPFATSDLSAGELAKLTTFCGFIKANGSGYGICKACRTGGLGASKQ